MTSDAAAPLVLYTEPFWLSPWDCACWVALREKGLPFSRSVAIMPGLRIAEELRQHTLAARIPALQHGDFWLSESVAIVEYLEEVFPPPRWRSLWPADARDRARARHLSILARMELSALRRDRPAWMIFYDVPSPPPLGPEARIEADEVVTATEKLLLAHGGPFLFGDFTVTDVDFAFALQRLIRTGVAVPAPVAELAARVWARPSVEEYVGHTRPPNPPREDANTYR
jgi:glutathione S-transferase